MGVEHRSAGLPVCPGSMKGSQLRSVSEDYVSMNSGMKKLFHFVLGVMCVRFLCGQPVFLQKQGALSVLSVCIPLISLCPVFIFKLMGSFII